MRKTPLHEPTVTLQDVARHAGVSPMTVSRAITFAGKVKPETRERVMAAARDLNYRPNIAARSLATQDVVRIAVLYANPSGAYLSALLLGMIEHAAEIGCQLVVERWDDNLTPAGLLAKLRLTSVDGIILPPPLSDSEAVTAALTSAKMPFVCVASGREAEDISSVSIDDFAAAHALTRHLIDLGHRTIGFITGDPGSYASHRRREGFVAAMSDSGLAVNPAHIQQGLFTYRSGMEAARLILSDPTPPTALFAANDDMAAGALASAQSLGLNVPGDLSIAGFDDTAMATSVWPELTTVHQPIGAMAREALRILCVNIHVIRGGEVPAISHETCAFDLMHRSSCAAQIADEPDDHDHP